MISKTIKIRLSEYNALSAFSSAISAPIITPKIIKIIKLTKILRMIEIDKPYKTALTGLKGSLSFVDKSDSGVLYASII